MNDDLFLKAPLTTSSRTADAKVAPLAKVLTMPALPLVVDLDGTLTKTDSLDETFLDALRTSPLSFWRLPIVLSSGPAAVKAWLAKMSPLAVETWPIRQDFLAFVEAEAAAGRKIVLATAADRSVAHAFAAHFSFIDQVVASDGISNLKGQAKAARLEELFPEGYIYAGNSEADLAVWRQARGSVVVHAVESVVEHVGRLGEPQMVFARSGLSFGTVARGLRLHQWVKNLLIFLPLILGGKAGDLPTWSAAIIGFMALSLAASATYVLNDLWDLPNDRRHWSKRKRPIASGDLSIRSGIAFAILGLAAGFGLAGMLSGPTLTMLLGYVVVTLSYSIVWKRIPILDVFVLAALFTLRLGIGVALSGVALSPWLLVFSMFVFLSLSVAKRHTEVLRLAERGSQGSNGRGYTAVDAPLTLGIGIASALGAVLILVLYLIEDAFPTGFYTNPVFLWVMPPILFLFLSRVWLLSQRGQLHDDPVAFALRDRVSLFLGILMALSFAAALFKLG